jgi:hypothetical protein
MGMYNDEVHPFHMKLGGGNHEPAISVSYQSIDSISTYLPIHFLGMRPSRFIVKIINASLFTYYKKIFIHLYAWPLVRTTAQARCGMLFKCD